VVEVDELGNNREWLEAEVGRLEASGDTALFDAVALAHESLERLGDRERINALVVMTDGRENNSYTSLNALVRKLRSDSPVRTVVFCIAYGSDADLWTLQQIAESTGGQVREGDLETIEDLYEVLSTYF
jgi:Ca-activated chloride channel family protein